LAGANRTKFTPVVDEGVLGWTPVVELAAGGVDDWAVVEVEAGVPCEAVVETGVLPDADPVVEVEVPGMTMMPVVVALELSAQR